jgi:integrase
MVEAHEAAACGNGPCVYAAAVYDSTSWDIQPKLNVLSLPGAIGGTEPKVRGSNPLGRARNAPQMRRLRPMVGPPEEVLALVRAAASEQDAALFLTAACTGLRRGELVALRWRDVGFERSAIRLSGSYTSPHPSLDRTRRTRRARRADGRVATCAASSNARFGRPRVDHRHAQRRVPLG